MEKILKGKFLVRKSNLTNGTPVLQITGVFFPQNFKIEEVKDNDEMWVSNIIISGGLRFTDPVALDASSPEDFLEGKFQSPDCWQKKEPL